MIVNVSAKSLPLNSDLSLRTSETVYKSAVNSLLTENQEDVDEDCDDALKNEVEMTAPAAVNKARAIAMRNNVRPGQEATEYAIDLTFDGNSFKGRAIIDVLVSQATRDKDLIFHAKDIVINNVEVALLPGADLKKTKFSKSGVQLKISPDVPFTSYKVIIEFSGQLAKHGLGLFRGQYDNE